MIKLLLGEQTQRCLILLIDLLQRQNFVRNFLSTYKTYFPVMINISVVKPKLLKFLSFCPENLVSNKNLNKGHSTRPPEGLLQSLLSFVERKLATYRVLFNTFLHSSPGAKL